MGSSSHGGETKGQGTRPDIPVSGGGRAGPDLGRAWGVLSQYTLGQQVSRRFRLIQDDVPRRTIVSPVYLQHVPPMAPFILFPEEYGPVHKDVQIVMRNGRVAQPPPVDRPFAGIDDRDEIHREDDEILRQLRTTQAHISIWSLLASSITHRDALIRALSEIRVDTATTPGGGGGGGADPLSDSG